MIGQAHSRALMFALAAMCAPARAATPLLPADWRNALIPSGFEDGEVRAIDNVTSSTSPSLRISTTSATLNPWDRRLLAIGSAAVKTGDTGLLRFRMRTLDMGAKPGYLKFVVESVSFPYSKTVEWSIQVDGEWRQYEVPFRFQEDFLASLYTIQFWFPLAPQTLEISSVTVENHGPVPYSALNLANYPYPGHAAGAEWRVEAERRIEQLRKRDVTVIVRDSNGKPVPNTPVRLKMKRHAFGFGSAVSADWLRDATADGEQYRRQVAKLFNSAVLENDLKWLEWESDRTRALLGLAWLKTAGIRQVRGHTILWPDSSRMPPDVPKQFGDPIALRARINKHIDEVVSAARGLVSEWDVVNEPASANVLAPVLGPGEMTKWFQQTRARDAAARLYVNEYGVVDDGGENIVQHERYAAVVEDLIARGAPLDGIGLQAHIGDHLTSPEALLKVLDRFGAYGKDLKITEFDVVGDSEATQASYMRDFLTAAFSHPKMTGVMLWGFWAGRHYRPEAALYRQDWTARPAADVWNDLVYKKWWSDVSGVTDASGAFHARVFYGDYDVEAGARDQLVTQSTTYSPASPEAITFGKFDVGTIAPTSVRNAASLAPGPVGTGEQLIIRTRDFGPEPAATAKADASGRFPTSLAGRQVLINGVAAPILETTADSIRCAIPAGLGAIASVQLNLFGSLTNTVWFPVAEAAPGVFTADGTGVGPAKAMNDDGAAITAATPGSYVTLRATGLGSAVPVRVLLGTAAAEATASSPAPGIAEVRFQVPADAKPGDAALRLTAAGQMSQDGVTLAIQ